MIGKKRKTNLNRLVLAGVFFVLIFMACMEKVGVLAALKPVGGSGVTIDSEGNMFMTTRSRIATSSIKYETLGWIVKRGNGPIQEVEHVYVKLTRYKPMEVDPENDAYCYNYFMVSKELLHQKIATVSKEWANDLYQNGGTLYLDAVMTVKERGISQGWLSDDGQMRGEVYTTFEGIAGARPWADKEALRTYYDKEISFGGNPNLLEQNESEQIEYVSVSSEIGPDQLQGVNSVILSSAIFEVEEAIPSGEAVTVEAFLQKYYYHGIYERHYGIVMVPVTAEVTYELKWNDGKDCSEIVTMEQFLEVPREYSYWRIKDLYLCYIDGLSVKNEALPNGGYEATGIYHPNITLIRNHGNYLSVPVEVVKVDGGTIDGGSRKPEIPEADATLVEPLVGEVLVQNDTFIVDGEVWMNGAQKERQTDNPSHLTGRQTCQVKSAALTIPKKKKNSTYETTAIAKYCIYEPATGFLGKEENAISATNAVAVHTPVYCQGVISDEKEFNQQLTPTSKKSLILGRELMVSVQTTGNHIDKKGYGKRNYQKYADKIQVRFPFPVTYNQMEIAENTWITLLQESISFGLPEAVKEGDYEVWYRSIAYNAIEASTQEQYANLNRENNVAYDVIPVTVVGRISDFRITNVVDYPRWEPVFRKEDGSAMGNVYYAGTSDKNGIKYREETEKFILPILAGSHTDVRVTTAPGLGYHQEFQIQTIGNMGDVDDAIWIKPTFYYVNKDGSGRREVCLYQKETLELFGGAFVLVETSRKTIEEGIQQWSGTYQIPPDVYVVDADIDLKEYVQQKKRIKTTDEVFLRGGYIVVHFEIRTLDAGEAALSYENSQNADAGYCNMWKVEGYRNVRTDGNGVTFFFQDGDVMVFDQTKNMLTDYRVMGTH